MMPIKKADYIGFTFNGIHSSELGIVRTSDGSRFNENLLPTIQDKTVQVPGGDGMYHFGSFYTQKQFTISYAFDALTEEQLTRMKNLFGDKKIHELIFDELPYKKYLVKVTGTASIKHIPFAEGETNRVYKGEGSVQFTAYDPYARSVYKFLNQYTDSNKDEWKGGSKMLSTQGSFDKLSNNNKINLYNPGVKESDFILTFNFKSGIIPAGGINIGSSAQLNFKQIESQNGDDQIKINTKLNLIEGYKGGKKSGKIYNNYITSGTFFKIPMTEETATPLQLVINAENSLPNYYSSIEYDYFYF